jgi:hypothetical protein
LNRVGASLAAPLGARLLGGLLALAGIALLVVGLIALDGSDETPPGAAPAPTSTASQAPTETGSPSVSPSPSPTSSAAAPIPTAPIPTATTTPPAPSPVARAPLTVLNNSTIPGLADRAAAAAERRGWRVAQVGNFAGRLPATTVYYTSGNAAEERAARQLAAEFPQIGQVLSRYAGLPPTPAGIVLVVTRDWS